MNSQLARLKDQIGRVEYALRSRLDLQNSRSEIDREETGRIFRNLKQCVHVAENFHSNVSSYAGSLYGGSLFNEPLSDDRSNSISDWIPEPAVWEEASSISPSTRLGIEDDWVILSSRNRLTATPQCDHDSDSDIDKTMIRKLLELGLSNFDQGEYAKAESYLRTVIHENRNYLSISDVQAVTMKLVASLCYQEMWAEAEKLVVPLAWTKGQNHVDPFHALHALALVYLQKSNFELAVKYCKQGVNGKRKILGKDNDSLFESISLLAQISDTKGDRTAAEAYRSLLLSDSVISLDALEYISRTLTFFGAKFEPGIAEFKSERARERDAESPWVAYRVDEERQLEKEAARSQLRGRDESESPPPLAIAHPSPARGSPPFPAWPLAPPDVVPPGVYGSHYQYNRPYPVHPGTIPQFLYPHPRVSSPLQVESTPPASPIPGAADEAIARLEKLIIEERIEREAQEAAREAAIARAHADKIAAEERAAADKKLAEEAAAKATAIARAEAKAEVERVKAEMKAEAEKKATEEAVKAMEMVEKAAAAATEAVTDAALKEKSRKKPIKFKDAVGRTFTFPFHLCNTWQGMEDLIRQAFLYSDAIGPHVAEGHYDLIDPSGDIILPQIWENVVEPDWTITMHMWPVQEKPESPSPPVMSAEIAVTGIPYDFREGEGSTYYEAEPGEPEG